MAFRGQAVRYGSDGISPRGRRTRRADFLCVGVSGQISALGKSEMTPPSQLGKTAVIVGATGNLGRALSTALQSAGWHIDPVWTSENRPDAARAESYAHLPKRIDFAAYLAGVNVIADTQDLAEADWDRVFATNLKGAFLFAKAAFPALCAAGRSSYVAISTINTLHPYPRRAAYAASKAGLEGLVRELA